MKVIAFDPGLTTGVAIGTVSSRDQTTGFRLLESYEVHWHNRLEVLHALFDNMFHSDGTVTIKAVVLESFRLYAAKARSQINSSFPSVQVIGAIEMLCYQHGIRDKVVFQSASQIARVQVLPEDYKFLNSEHTRDAYKHLRLYCLKSSHEEK